MSYVSLSEADEYHSQRASFEGWDVLDEQTKQRRLMSAADFLDANYRFTGEKAMPEQVRQFPRSGDDSVPLAVKFAVCELALQENLNAEPENEMQSVSVGAVNVSYRSSGFAKTGSNRFSYVKTLLRPYLADFGARLVRG